MKKVSCNIIKDILPLYLDDVVGDDTKKMVEEHLSSCCSCRQEAEKSKKDLVLSGSPDFQLAEAKMLKKIRTQRRRQIFFIVSGVIVSMAVVGLLLFSRIYRPVNFEDVSLSYGVEGDMAYFIIESPGHEFIVNGAAGEKYLNLEILSSKKAIGTNGRLCYEDLVGTEDDPCRWVLQFHDKTIIIENGKLMEEKENP